MRKTTLYFTVILLSMLIQNLFGQEEYKTEIEHLKAKKEKIIQQEKEALKEEVKEINLRMKRGNLTAQEAKLLKMEVAKKRALNIENRVAIVDNQIALLERNQGNNDWIEENSFEEQMKFFEDENIVLGLKIKKSDFPKSDKKTRSNFVIGLGLHNNIIEGKSLLDTPHQVLGSRYFELGYTFKTRVFRNSNWFRITYGITYLSRGLKTDNQLFIKRSVPGSGNDGRLSYGDVTLENANVFFASETGELRKSKFRQDDIIIPFHFEFGPSSKRQYENFVRYSTKNKFRFGIGAYLGLNLSNVQKIEFNSDFNPQGISDGRSFLSNNGDSRRAFWGLSAYVGRGSVTWHLKYDITPNFGDSTDSMERNNISLGLRFDL